MPAKLILATEAIPITSIGVVIYGRPGVRKTSLAQTAAKPFTFAFDKGIYRCFGRRDCATFDTWEDVVQACRDADSIRSGNSSTGELANAVANAGTLVIDTIALAMESLARSICQDSKMGNRNGGLSIAGYGVLANRFASWVTDRHSVGQDVVMIAHEDSEKVGDEEYHFPAVLGRKFYATLMYHADLVGYIQVQGGKYILDFNPSDGYMAKAPPCKWPSMSLPDFAGAPDFLDTRIKQAKAAMGKASCQSSQIVKIVEEWTEWLSTDPNIDQLNERLPSLSKLDQLPKRQVWSKVQSFAKEGGLSFDTAGLCFYRPEVAK